MCRREGLASLESATHDARTPAPDRIAWADELLEHTHTPECAITRCVWLCAVCAARRRVNIT